MRSIRSLAVLAAFVATSCAGGEFKLEGPLRATPPMALRGTLGMSAHSCMSEQERDKTRTVLDGLAADREVSLSVGTWRGTASAPHRELKSSMLFGEKTRDDFRSFIPRFETPVLTTVKIATQVDKLLAGIDMILSLPGKIEETMTFTLLAEHEGRVITAMCASTDWAHLLGFFDSVKFTLACRILSSADEVPRDLVVRAGGSWVNAHFDGELRASPSDRLRFVSQNVSVLGMEGVRGFDLRSETGSQVGAISFWHTQRSANAPSEARAWLPPSPSTGARDAMLTALAIGYLYPWPTACDAQRMRNNAMQNMSRDLSKDGGN